jgi:23S rRNA (cytosine1962-C5)-methyltransferase
MLAWLDALPAINTRPINMRIEAGAKKHLRRGHPWLFDASITHQSHRGEAGDVVVVYDDRREFVAVGTYEPSSPIRVRLLAHKKPTTIDDAFFARRVDDAIAHRSTFLDGAAASGPTTGYRVIHGENDGLPGLVVDRYGDTLVIKIYAAGWLPRLRQVVPSLVAALSPTRIVLRWSRSIAGAVSPFVAPFISSNGAAADNDGATRGDDGVVVAGPGVSDLVAFTERGLVFLADPLRGQKTGFFLDQRDNRARVENMSAGRRVLNVFSYSGGFSLAAARGGATHVTSVDLSKPALRDAERIFAENAHHPGVKAAVHHTIAGDAFDVMANLADDGARFDVVVIDPPSFAKSAAEIDGALAAYRRLGTLGLALTERGGDLVLASCSSRVSPEAFQETMEDAADVAGFALGVVDVTGHASDHPVGFAEGRYLKCIYARPRLR